MIEFIKSCGYRVFMRDPADEHCFYTDAAGERIAYAQWSRYQPSVSTVHIPDRNIGTGFGVADDITKDTLARALNMGAPEWATQSQWQAVKKWANWNAYTRANAWNSQLKEV